MSGLCLAAAGLVLALPLQGFTLAWTHSIEKVRWEEDYRITAGRLQVVEARILGTGAGMEPPPDAVLKEGVWHYRPQIAPLERVRLTRSGYVADYQFCAAGQCRPLGDIVGAQADTVDMYACDTGAGPARP
ncbi:DUF1850 domain-containing protein [Noviherbaspirillum pedocola]|uniref:DUF1850 domain-containing protein n=1 Tax=Noviherbaspirillum pedocola TaxID=2801341 RepID=A0A934SSV2_9BURK|nr:DUF1850 domain-containing protein [Noviherbaspirillum pedocola]MBK4734825.1 DUF1850 domain-containing protein [Noviherbaspirillum pedocola]